MKSKNRRPQKNKRASKIEYGEVNVIDEKVLNPAYQKHRISIWLDGDVLDALKSEAFKLGCHYRKLLAMHLRRAAGLGEYVVTWSTKDEVYIATDVFIGVKAHGNTIENAVRELSIARELVLGMENKRPRI